MTEREEDDQLREEMKTEERRLAERRDEHGGRAVDRGEEDGGLRENRLFGGRLKLLRKMGKEEEREKNYFL
ncbi:Uncharacterized protein TCM_034398 [Theobroma cacao]|uniref:Uncharacterized protein n=1 Tax=Theobroma cacao TaxID=3641 RepID=A0A061FLB9_THECC|nr:Uncharacterized protein TCM_034398 [Theobroma cacao]